MDAAASYETDFEPFFETYSDLPLTLQIKAQTIEPDVSSYDEGRRAVYAASVTG
jgi:hypothetical protein